MMKDMSKMLNFYCVEHDDYEGDERIVTVRGYDSNVGYLKFFEDVAKTIAFDDCTDEEVVDIVWHGEHVHYAGWQPGMHYEFVNDNNESVCDMWFPEWDH